MSHLKERKEKSCLNCNAVVNGKFCSVCGQENLEPQESLWHLIVHFFNDITHFDGKFFSSLKYVVTKPGFLTSEYIRGRRTSYLNPVRFYVFTSFIFFLIIFSFFVKSEDVIKKSEKLVINTQKDSVKLFKKLQLQGNDSAELVMVMKIYGIDSIQKLAQSVKGKSTIFHLYSYDNRAEFDSLNKIKKIERNFIDRILMEKQFELQEKYDNDHKGAKEALKEKGLHLIPQVLLLSLPFFALLLKLLYTRQQKFYYVSHIIFTIHFYIFVYIAIIGILVLRALSELPHLHFLDKVINVLWFIFPLYLYKAVRHFYEQRRAKTILKLFILSFALMFLSIFFMLLLFGLTIFKM